MKDKVMFLLGLIVLIAVVVIIINNIKEKAYAEGYKHGESDVIALVISTSYWFSGKDIKLYNALQLFGLRYKKYRGVSANEYREDILKMNHNRHFTELPREEVERII